MLRALQQDLQRAQNPAQAKVLRRFFKTGPGEYGEGDRFLGITVPQSRAIARKYQELPLLKIEQLLYSTLHEVRLIALLILVEQFKKGTPSEQKIIYNFYLRHVRQVNNWDLVDLTAPKIVGAYLFEKDKKILVALAHSRNLWERRIAIVSTFSFIRQDEYKNALKIAKLLIRDDHDLIHKAVGWMLREVGKRSLVTEEGFLEKYYRNMPRTMLRYAIERFPEAKRQKYLKNNPATDE
ncbi:MAG: DNA alkylation repair protein [Candidatus Magasanikbacteria bacterium]|nr:DNA alkylation repair protein [Candidatus Magasanikbacteria bacterium]